MDIRNIKPEEVDKVFAMLVQLAKHEKLDARLKLTPSRMREELFGPHADWHCLVAVMPDEQIIGFSLFSFANINRAFNLTPLIHIDDIYVSKEYRKLGIGKKFLGAIANIAVKCGINRIELWCIKDNDLGQVFYKQLGARKLDFLDVYQLEVASLIEVGS